MYLPVWVFLMPVWVLVRVFASRANMPHSCSSLLAVVLLRFQRIAEDIASGLDAFCVCVGVHFERDTFIGMTEFFGNRSGGCKLQPPLKYSEND